jgi:hypothetical protein
MRKKITALSLVYLGVASIGFAQESKIYTHDDRQYQEALALYHNKQYQAAQTLFDKVRANTGDTETEANSAYYVPMPLNGTIRLIKALWPEKTWSALTFLWDMPYTLQKSLRRQNAI